MELSEIIARVPANRYYQMQILEIGEGYIKIMMPYNPVYFTDSGRNAHGGALMTFEII
jgi:acyl-coenzyme A thioesterase PaaI-like protein